MKPAATALLCCLLSGCVAGGLFNMDDRWCAQHHDAPRYQCQR